MTARVCVLTPEARGAVAVVRVWGTDALRLVDSVFRPARGGPLSTSPLGAIRLAAPGGGATKWWPSGSPTTWARRRG